MDSRVHLFAEDLWQAWKAFDEEGPDAARKFLRDACIVDGIMNEDGSRLAIGEKPDDPFDRFTRILRTLFQAYQVMVHDWSTDDPSIRHFVHVVGVPQDRLVAVEDLCWSIAMEVYGTETIPFLLTAVSPETEAGR